MSVFMRGIQSLFVVLFLLAFLNVHPAYSTTITFGDDTSGYTTSSSNETKFIPSDIDLTLDFAVNGSALTLQIDNTSNSYRIRDVYFNVTSNITDLVIANTGGSLLDQLTFGMNQTTNYGIFDVNIHNGGQDFIEPGSSFTYTINMTGSGITDTDFIDENTLTYVAAIGFKQVGDGNGTAGIAVAAGGNPQAIVPEPSSILLLGSGLFGLMALGRRK